MFCRYKHTEMTKVLFEIDTKYNRNMLCVDVYYKCLSYAPIWLSQSGSASNGSLRSVQFVIVKSIYYYHFQSIMIFGFVMYEPLTYEEYEYPLWANLLGWGIAMSSIVCMPTLAVIQILRQSGTFSEVCGFCIQLCRLSCYS